MKRSNYHYETKRKLLTRLVSLLIYILPGIFLNAQVTSFNITVQNLVQTATNKLEFDVYLLDTDPAQTFELGSCQLGFLFNSQIYFGGRYDAFIE